MSNEIVRSCTALADPPNEPMSLTGAVPAGIVDELMGFGVKRSLSWQLLRALMPLLRHSVDA